MIDDERLSALKNSGYNTEGISIFFNCSIEEVEQALHKLNKIPEFRCNHCNDLNEYEERDFCNVCGEGTYDEVN